MFKRIVLPLLFLLSGATALIYEVVWLRILGLIFGNTTHAISIVLAVFMGGLGLGSYFLGRYFDHAKKRLLLYGLIEIAIGLYASLTFLLQKGITAAYVGFAQFSGEQLVFASVVRLLLAALLFFIPTFLMGATFPLFMRFYTDKVSQSGRSAGFLYGINTVGAFLGVIAAGFFLLPALGMRSTLAVAVCGNISIGLVACLLAKTKQFSSEISSPTEASLTQSVAVPENNRPWILPAMVLVGAVAMVFEICWTRSMAVTIGSSTYAFSLMLASFLLGIALGSLAMRSILKKIQPTAYLWSSILILMVVSGVVIFSNLDAMNILAVRIHAFAYGHYVLWQVLRFVVMGSLMLIPAMCFGALFPLSVALYTRDEKAIAASTGKVYLFNTIGNIGGSLMAGFFLIPKFGIYSSVWGSMVLILAFAVYLFLMVEKQTKRPILWGIGAIAIASVLLIVNVKPWNENIVSRSLFYRPVSYFRQTHEQILANLFQNKVLFYEEGLNSSVSVRQSPNGHRSLFVNGKPDASTNNDMGTQLISGHLPHLVHEDPKKTLVIGFGSGVTLAASLAHHIELADLAEIEEEVVRAGSFFADVNRKAYEDPRTNIISNDGRSHLLTTNKRYDVIISEPSNPWMAGVSNLFTREFYQLVDKRLLERGIFCQWISAYDMSQQNIKQVIAAIHGVFKTVTMWRTPSGGDILVLASQEPFDFNLTKVGKKIKTLENVREDLARFEIRGAASLLPYQILNSEETDVFVKEAQQHTDDGLALEFNLPKLVFDQRDSSFQIYNALYRYQNEENKLKPQSARYKDKPYLLSQIGFGYLGRKKLNVALPFFERALKVKEGHVPSTIGKVRILLERKRYRTAQRTLERIKEEFPKHSELRALYGRVLLLRGKAKDAVPYLEKAVEKKPKRIEYLEWLAGSYFVMKKYAEAVPILEKLMDLDNNKIRYHTDYARLFRMMKETEKSVGALEKLFDEYPMFWSVFDELNEQYRIQKQYHKQIAIAEKLVSHNPYRVSYWRTLLKLYQNHQPEKWDEGLRRLDKLNPYVAEELAAQPSPAQGG